MKNSYSNKFLAIGVVMALAAGPRLLGQLSDQTIIPKAQAVAPAPTPILGAHGGVAVASGSVVPAAGGVPLRNGDTVEIRIANVPEQDVGQISGLYTLDESGMMNLPFIGLIKAGGLPPSQVQLAIQNKYIAQGIYTNPTVMVNPPMGTRAVSVSGAVRAPQRVPFSSDLTLMSAIDAAGGPSDFAGDIIKLVHNGKIQKYSRKKLNKDPSKDPAVEPGDRIEVVESWY